jgi:NAD(P)H-dependent flavin oxidoreductase YrpB (nitropropane dioxygenase family)
VRSVVDGIVVIGGGIGTAAEVAEAIDAGADAVRIGTRFLAATESPAHPSYVDALIAADAGDTELTTAYGWGWPDAPHRVLRACIAANEASPEPRWTPEWPTADSGDDPLTRALYAGESVGAVTRRQSAADIVAELIDRL